MTDTSRDFPDDDAAGVALLVDAYKRWAAQPPVTVSLGCRDAYIAIGGLQLLMRYPGLEPTMQAALERVGRTLQNAICDDAELYVLVETGWDPVRDVEQ